MILKFSGLTTEDHFSILATRAIQRRRQWQCENCKALPETKKAWGCEAPVDMAQPIGGVYSVSMCPGNYYSENAVAVMEAYELFKMGFLPNPGTVMEQPAEIMEAFAVISSLDNAEAAQKAKQRKPSGK